MPHNPSRDSHPINPLGVLDSDSPCTLHGAKPGISPLLGSGKGQNALFIESVMYGSTVVDCAWGLERIERW
jgi:hypothetical protein